MDADSRNAIAELLIKDSMHKVNNGKVCSICGDAVRPLAFNMLRNAYPEHVLPPKEFIKMAISYRSIKGVFPVCDKCAPPCKICGLPIPKEKVLEYGYSIGATIGNGICKNHFHVQEFITLILKRIFKLGRFRTKKA
jgi:hypothetical protein